MEQTTWLIPLIFNLPLEFLYQQTQTIHVTGTMENGVLLVSARVHVPGHFTWGFNRIPTDKPFSVCVKDVIMKVLGQMYQCDADATALLSEMKAIWNSKL